MSARQARLSAIRIAALLTGLAALPLLISACTPVTITTATPTLTVVPTAVNTPTSTVPPTETTTTSPTPTLTPDCYKWLGQVQEVALDSPLMYEPFKVSVFLPPCYALYPDQHYPVLYLFHGLFYSNDQWTRLGFVEMAEKMMATGQIPAFIIVLPYDPNGRQPSASAFDEVFINQAVPYVDGHFRTITNRAGRAVGGLSRGAGWAIHFGLTHPELFGSIGAHSPVIFWEDEEHISAWLDSIPRKDLPRIYLDMGENDPNSTSAQTFDELLVQKKIPHEWHVNPGYHNEDYWSSQVENYVRWYAAGW